MRTSIPKRLLRWVIVVASTVAGSFVSFALWLQVFPVSWKSSEYGAIAFWTIPLGGLVLVCARVVSRFRGRRGLFVSLAVLSVLLSTIVWTYLAIALSGGYALAFDANPLYCWLVGAIVGTIVAHLRGLRSEDGSGAAA